MQIAHKKLGECSLDSKYVHTNTKNTSSQMLLFKYQPSLDFQDNILQKQTKVREKPNAESDNEKLGLQGRAQKHLLDTAAVVLLFHSTYRISANSFCENFFFEVEICRCFHIVSAIILLLCSNYIKSSSCFKLKSTLIQMQSNIY